MKKFFEIGDWPKTILATSGCIAVCTAFGRGEPWINPPQPAASGGGPRVRRQAEVLRQLERGAPRTAYEAIHLIYLYFVLSEHVDFMQCRSLSVIDQTLWPYYRADLAAGRTTEAEFRKQFLHFLWQWGSIDNYWGQPITVGGTGMDGKTAGNPLTRIVLEVADAYG